MRALALLVLSSLAGAAVASERAPPVREGHAYALARAALMKEGFRPVPSGHRDAGRCSAGRQDVCAAYPETVSCSGTGNATCRFIFSGAGGAVTLEADGPDAGRLRVSAVRRSGKKDAEWQRR